MNLPFFYITQSASANDVIILDEDNSKHAVQVLRMKEDEPLMLTDGVGTIYNAVITDAHKKKCAVKISSVTIVPPPDKKIIIAVSPVKNNSRFEWFLEKATEAGVSAIVPLVCTRSAKDHFRLERMRGILISAMLQSQQAYLPLISEPVKFADVVSGPQYSSAKKYIAHCDETEKTSLRQLLIQSDSSSEANTNQSHLILIGPEGDFTWDEISIAVNKGYQPVMLGNTRLRTETAAVVAAVLLCID